MFSMQDSRATESLPMRVRVPLLLAGSLLGIVLAVLLLINAKMLSSRLFGLSVLSFLALISWLAVTAPRRMRGRSHLLVAGILVAAGGAFFAWSSAVSPSGRPSADAKLQSVFRSSERFGRFSPAWLVSEGDQVRLGGILLPYLDPMMRSAQGRKFSRAFESVYGELEKSPNFMDAGSALGEAYANMFLGAGPVGHMYVYFPEKADAGPFPVLVFLHGWLGNLKAYTWAWREFAEENSFVIIAPSFGNGMWSGQRADKMLKWIDQFIRKDVRLDQSRVVIVGLSNGGTGVTRWAKVLPDSYRGLVYVSPVMGGTSDSPDFISSVGSRPILVVHGSADSRISPSRVEQHVTALRGAGANIQRLSYRGEDHVLILSSRNRLRTDLRRWMVKYGLLEEFKQQE